ncbi:MAG: hypothetical protein QM778_28555 [Myxococcales bacterium]
MPQCGGDIESFCACTGTVSAGICLSGGKCVYQIDESNVTCQCLGGWFYACADNTHFAKCAANGKGWDQTCP